MSNVELANAWVNIVPDTKDIAPGVKKALGVVDKSAEKAGNSMGQKLSGALSKSLKAGAVAAGAAVGGVLAGSIAKGFGRMTAIEGAEAKLKGLGNSAEDVAGIMDNALASVKGTANGLGEAATVSASMVAAGIKPGEELERTLKTVGDTAAIAGRSMEDVGLIFGSVAARGKLQGDDMLQLMSSGIPVLQLLAEETGKTSGEISDMVSAGEIDFATFESAMRNGLGGAALEMGNTVQGAVKNVGAAMGRFGEALIGPIYNSSPKLLSAVTGLFDSLTDAVKPVSEQLEGLLGPAVERLSGLIEQNVTPAVSTFVQWLGKAAVALTEKAVDPGLWEQIGGVFSTVADTARQLWPSIESLGSALLTVGQSVSVATWQALASVLNALAPLIQSVLVPLVEKVAEFAAQNPGAVQAVVMGFLGFKAIGAVLGPVKAVTSSLKNAGGAVKFVFDAFKNAGKAGGVNALIKGASSANPIIAGLGKSMSTMTKVVSIAGRAFSVLGNIFKVALRAINPWVAGITLVVGALTWFFTKTETGRAVFQKLVDAIGAGWDWIVEKTQGVVAFLGSAFSTAASAVQSVFSQIWAVIQPVAAAIWGVIKQVGQVAMNIFGGYLAVVFGLAMAAWNALSAAFTAVWQSVLKPIFDAFGQAVSWLYNAVILPTVDWIIAKWNQLSAALAAAWTFIKTTVIDAFSAAMTWLWQNAIQPVIDWIVSGWNQLSAALQTAWNFIKTSVIDGFAAGMQWLWNNAVQPVIAWITEKWNWLGGVMSATWQWISSNVLTPFKNGLQQLRSFFGTVVDGIRSVWNGLKSALAAPINFMINTVYNNGIAKAWDTIGGFLPLNPKTAKRLSPIAGYATGGAIRGEGTGTSDSILAWLSNGEHVWTAADVRAIGGQGALYAMREAITKKEGFTFDGEKLAMLPHINNRVGDLAGAAPGLFPAFKDGGEVRPMWEIQLERGHKWAKSRHGRPYVLGGSADGSGGTDCSGFMSGIANVIQGGNGARQWATMSFNGGGNQQQPSGPQGFVAGLKANTLSIGVTNGGAAGGHTAGTLGAVGIYPAVNVESGGAPSQVKYGVGAVGADDGYFRTHYHLPIGPDGAFVSGGNGSVSPEQMKKTIGDRAGAIFKRIMSPIRDLLPAGPPAWKNIPRGVFDKTTDAFPKAIDATIDGLKDGLATVYHAVGEVAGSMWDSTKDVAKLAGRAIGLHDQGGWLKSGNLALNLSGKPEPVLTNSQWATVAAGIRQIGNLIPALKGQTDAIANKLIPALEKMADPTSLEGIAARAFGSRTGGILDSLGFDATSKVTTALLSAEEELVAARAGHAERLADIEHKERALAQAHKSLAEAQSASAEMSVKDKRKLADAERALAEARKPSSGGKVDQDKVAKAEEKLARVREDLAAKGVEDEKKRAEAIKKSTQDVAKAESELMEARKKSAEALDMRIFDVAPQIHGALSQAASATSAIPAVSGVLGRLAAAAGPAGVSVGMALSAVEQGIKVAKVVIEVVDQIVGGVLKARSEVFKAVAGAMDAIVQLNSMIDKQRETVAGLRIDMVMAQIELSAAMRNVRITQLDGVRAQLESTKTLAEAQAKFDAQRRSDMQAAAAQYDDLSLAFDRFRWNAKAGMDGLVDDVAGWSDETRALFAELEAARIGQIIAEKEAQKANLEATYKAALAVMDLQTASTNLQFATQQLAMMSGKSFGFDSPSAMIGARISDLLAEQADLKAQKGKNWWRLISWHASGASKAANDRIKQIDEEVARLKAMPDFKGFSDEQQKSIDSVLARAGWMGAAGGAEHIANLIKSSALGDPQRALDDLKLQQDLLNLKQQQEALKDKIARGQAEVEYRGQLDPLETEIKGLEMERGAKQAWAEYWRAENAGVRDALAELARHQEESAKQVKALADEARTQPPVTLVGSTASMDDVQKLLESLGHRVDRLERPTPTASAVVAARR